MNPDKIGEFQAFYYQIGQVNIDTTDSGLLINAGWKELCVVSTDVNNTFTEHMFNDTCSPDIEEVAPGRRQWSADIEVNLLRWPNADLQAWHAAIDGRSIIALLILVSERTDLVNTYGWVGNFIATQDNDTFPQEGPMTESYIFRPAARSTTTVPVRRIYGSGYPAPTMMAAPATLFEEDTDGS